MTLSFLSQLVGSFAMPAGENPTVAMMEAAFRHHDLDWRYINCEVAPDDLGAAVEGARAMGWAGFNCSIPHKVAVIEHIAGLGKSAEIIGAANTMIRHDNGFIGENTDGQGFVRSIREKTGLTDKRVVMFGAGGAEIAFRDAQALGVAERGVGFAALQAQRAAEDEILLGVMRRAGGGSIINISSQLGMVGMGESSPQYQASKGAVRIFTKSTAIQYAAEGIRANSVHPGPVITPMTEARRSDAEVQKMMISRIPLGRYGESADVAYGVLYLASDESSFVTGSELVIDGGWTAQ